MPLKPQAAATTLSACSILQLKIRLLGIGPMIWRRVLLPASTSLQELHGIIQAAMGWEGLHLYQFRIRAVAYGSFDLDLESARASERDGVLS